MSLMLSSRPNGNDASRFLTARVRHIMDSHEVPDSVCAEHEMTMLPRMALTRVLVCACGFRREFDVLDFLTTQHPGFNDAILEHALEVASTFCVTIQELTDLGWFVDDEYGSL